MGQKRRDPWNCNPRIWGLEAGGSDIQVRPGLDSKACPKPLYYSTLKTMKCRLYFKPCGCSVVNTACLCLGSPEPEPPFTPLPDLLIEMES